MEPFQMERISPVWRTGRRSSLRREDPAARRPAWPDRAGRRRRARRSAPTTARAVRTHSGQRVGADAASSARRSAPSRSSAHSASISPVMKASPAPTVSTTSHLVAPAPARCPPRTPRTRRARPSSPRRSTDPSASQVWRSARACGRVDPAQILVAGLDHVAALEQAVDAARGLSASSISARPHVGVERERRRRRGTRRAAPRLPGTRVRAPSRSTRCAPPTAARPPAYRTAASRCRRRTSPTRFVQRGQCSRRAIGVQASRNQLHA